MKNNQPLITIIMAVYNAEQWLHKSIGSVLDQTYANWELLCMDDGSTDNSLLKLKEFAEQDRRVHMYTYEHTGSHSAMVNKAINLSKGEYVTTIDADDYISCDYLELAIKRLLDTNADLCISSMYRVGTNGEILSTLEGVNGDTDLEITAHDAVVYSLDWSISALGVWKKRIFIDIPADESGYSIEYTSRQRLFSCNKVVFSTGIYNYVQHNQAITKRLGPRQFYYVILDAKILQFLRDNQFEEKILCNYFYDSYKRLISRCCLFYASKKKLLKSEQKLVNEYISTSYVFLHSQFDLIDKTLHRFTKKQQLLLKCSNRLMFNLYCYLRRRK